jgi:hypothetical protein
MKKADAVKLIIYKNVHISGLDDNLHKFTYIRIRTDPLYSLIVVRSHKTGTCFKAGEAQKRSLLAQRTKA